MRETRQVLPQSLVLLLSLSAFGHVHYHPHHLCYFANCVQNRVADGTNISDGRVRKQNSELRVQVRFVGYCSVECLFISSPILGMNSLQPLFPGGHSVRRIKVLEAMPFLRKVHGSHSYCVKNPAPDVRHTLRLCQVGFTPL